MSSTQAIFSLLQAASTALEAAKKLMEMQQTPAPATPQQPQAPMKAEENWESVSDGWPAEELDFEQVELVSVSESAQEVVSAEITAEGKVYPAFCTAGEDVIRLKFVKISDFANAVAFHYRMKQDIGNAFYTMNREDYIKHLCTIPLEEARGGFVSPKQAKHIYNSMKSLTDNIGKEIVVAVAKSQGGGLEIRRVTGPYRFMVEGITGDGTGYWHQFPTKLVRKLTPEENNKVTDARRTGDSGIMSMNWKVTL